MDEDRVIASAIADNELAQAFSDLVAERWDNWDLSPYMVHLVDVCDKSLLPYLADQFDIDGLQGFAIADNEEQQRDLIKRSIALHKYIGTPWAIREACRTVGFPVILLEEGVTAQPGGPTSPEDWARFRVLVQAEESRHITQDEARKLRQFVEYYKNFRSELVELGFYHAFTDKVFTSEQPDRDKLDILILSLSETHLLINPDGALKEVTVQTNCPWTIDECAYEWPDGSGDKLYISFTGAPGESVINVYSDPNKTGDREITIEIKTTDNRMLGTLTIEQNDRWRHAYSNAYSNAYCSLPRKLNAYSSAYSHAYSAPPYLRLTAEHIFLTKEDPEKQIHIITNGKWEAE